MRNDYLTDMFRQAKATTERVTTAFGELGGAQLNWKPSADAWSIGQCLDHLIVSDEEYFPQLEAIVAGRKETTLWERVPLLPRGWGALLRQAVNPDTRRKVKTFTVFQPSTSDLPATIVADFASHTDRLVALITATDGVDHERVVITSPVAGFITYSLKDAVIVMVTHLERHYRQARAVREYEGFPP